MHTHIYYTSTHIHTCIHSTVTHIHIHTHTHIAHTYAGTRTHTYTHTYTRSPCPHHTPNSIRGPVWVRNASPMVVGFASAGRTGQAGGEHSTVSSTLAPSWWRGLGDREAWPQCLAGPSLPSGFRAWRSPPPPQQPWGPSGGTQEATGAARRGAGNGAGTGAPPLREMGKVLVSGRRVAVSLLPSQGLGGSLPTGLWGGEHY